MVENENMSVDTELKDKMVSVIKIVNCVNNIDKIFVQLIK